MRYLPFLSNRDPLYSHTEYNLGFCAQKSSYACSYLCVCKAEIFYTRDNFNCLSQAEESSYSSHWAWKRGADIENVVFFVFQCFFCGFVYQTRFSHSVGEKTSVQEIPSTQKSSVLMQSLIIAQWPSMTAMEWKGINSGNTEKWVFALIC